MPTTLRDEIAFESLDRTASTEQNVLIYFILGNPGLVSYYDTFLSNLSKLLRQRTGTPHLSSQNASYTVYGASLAGFDIHDGSCPPKRKSSDRALPLSLNEQVEDAYDRLALVAKEFNDGTSSVPVVLIGHSIGSWIAMQIVQRWRNTTSSSSHNFRIIGCIGLFPTIFELAQSPTGRKVGPLTRIPGFAYFVHVIAKLLFYFVPIKLVTSLVSLITGMTSEPATVTAAFLKSPDGVRQALHMAKDELAQLTHDTWDDDFWEGRAANVLSSPAANISEPTPHSDGTSAHSNAAHTQLFFYWGANDHWVANTTRDAIIAKRARTQHDPRGPGKPIMEVDAHGIPHAFCLRKTHSEQVASACANWIMGLVE